MLTKEERLYTTLPLEVNEGFNDLHTMTKKELEKEYKKNLKRIEELNEEDIQARKEKCPSFSITEQISELEKYGKAIKAQIKEYEDNGIDTSAYEESYIHVYEMASDDILATATKVYKDGNMTEEEYKKFCEKIDKAREREKANIKRLKEKEAEEARKQAEKDKKPLRRLKKVLHKSLSDYAKKIK